MDDIDRLLARQSGNDIYVNQQDHNQLPDQYTQETDKNKRQKTVDENNDNSAYNVDSSVMSGGDVVSVPLISSTGKIYDSADFDIPEELLNDAPLAPTYGSNTDSNESPNIQHVKQNNTNVEDDQYHCVECDSVKVQLVYMQAFDIPVCYLCQRQEAEKYDLITKSAAKADYLLDDTQLAPLRFMLKRNPAGPTYNSMKLYRRHDVQTVAFSKYVDMEGIENEKLRRHTTRVRKDDMKRKKAKQRVEREERAERYAAEYSVQATAQHHVHTYKQLSGNKSECTQCGFVVEEIEL